MGEPHGPVDDDADFHREVGDTWDDDDYAVTGPVEAHGRGLDFGLLLLRLGPLPLILYGLNAAVDMPAFTDEVAGNLLGAQAPDFFAWLVMLSLVGLPVLVVLGLFTRPAAFLIAGLMALVWAVTIYPRTGYTVLTPEGAITGENAVLYLLLTLPLVYTGAGRLSVDGLRTGGRP